MHTLIANPHLMLLTKAGVNICAFTRQHKSEMFSLAKKQDFSYANDAKNRKGSLYLFSLVADIITQAEAAYKKHLEVASFPFGTDVPEIEANLEAACQIQLDWATCYLYLYVLRALTFLALAQGNYELYKKFFRYRKDLNQSTCAEHEMHEQIDKMMQRNDALEEAYLAAHPEIDKAEFEEKIDQLKREYNAKKAPLTLALSKVHRKLDTLHDQLLDLGQQ